MENKRANLDITIFIIMVFIICIYALANITAYKNKLELKLTSYTQVEKIQLEKKDLEYSLKKYLEECLIESYFEIIEKKEFYEGQDIGGIFFLNKIKEDANENLINKTKKCIKEKAKKDYDIYITQIIRELQKEKFLEKLKKEKFELNNEEEISLKIEEIDFSKEEVKYRKELKTKFVFREERLLNWNDINKTLFCENEECIKNLTKNLFFLDIEEKTESRNNKNITYKIYNFISLKEFYLNGEFKKISFEIKKLEKIE